MNRQSNLKHQCLILQVEPTLICILERATIHIPILRDEIIVADTEHKPFIVIPKQPIHRHDPDTLPLLIEEICVLSSAVMSTETIELRVEVHVDERAICSWCNILLQDAYLGSDRAVRAIVNITFDIRRSANIKDINMSIIRQRHILSMSKVRVSRQHEKLSVLDVEKFRLGGYFRVLGGLCGRIDVEWEGDYEFPGVARLRGDGDVVFEEAGVALGLGFEAAFLVGGCLQEDVEVLAVA